MGHNSRQGFYLGQELLLEFAAWIDLTSNADNSLISKQRSKLQNTFCFFETCWRLTGLLRLYDASQPPGRLQRYFTAVISHRRPSTTFSHLTSVKHFHDNSRVYFVSVSQPCSIVVQSGIIAQLWQSNLQFRRDGGLLCGENVVCLWITSQKLFLQAKRLWRSRHFDWTKTKLEP